MIFIRSLIYYLLLTIATIVFLVVGIIMLPLNYPLRFRVMSKWSTFNLWTLKHVCRLDYVVEGMENIPEGPAIIMCKHQSAWETLAMQMIFPPQVWILKRELLLIPIYGWGLASMQPIAINRSSAIRSLKQIVKEGTKRLQAGLWVVIFPEGTRTLPGAKMKYQVGGGLLAEKSEFPIVPVAHNAGNFWPRMSLNKYPGTIKMIIGPVIQPHGKSAKQLTREVEDWIESTVASLPAPALKD
jgi:1-acyl-sn-glycerol-3-phosphate acyltransferase